MPSLPIQCHPTLEIIRQNLMEIGRSEISQVPVVLTGGVFRGRGVIILDLFWSHQDVAELLQWKSTTEPFRSNSSLSLFPDLPKTNISEPSSMSQSRNPNPLRHHFQFHAVTTELSSGWVHWPTPVVLMFTEHCWLHGRHPQHDEYIQHTVSQLAVSNYLRFISIPSECGWAFSLKAYERTHSCHFAIAWCSSVVGASLPNSQRSDNSIVDLTINFLDFYLASVLWPLC